VAELDCDIIIDDAPDSITPALEQFQAIIELKKFDTDNEMPFRAIVKAAPNLRNKDQIFAEMDKRAQEKTQNPMAQQAQQLQMRGAAAEVAETESKAALNIAKAQEAGMPEQGAPMQPQEFEVPPEIQVHKALADIGLVEANTLKAQADTRNKQVMTALAPAKADHDAQMSEAQLAQRAKQMNRPQQRAAQ
jgi:hypothetical protein